MNKEAIKLALQYIEANAETKDELEIAEGLRQAIAEAEKQQRTWVGLTDQDMNDPKTHNLDFILGARWAEEILKDRNK